MKPSVALVAVCLVGCQDLTMGSAMPPGASGPDDPMNPPMGDPGGDPRDTPFLGDINNNWWNQIDGVVYSFTFTAKPDGKSSSAVIGGTLSLTPGGSFDVDGIFYDHTVHLMATQGEHVLIFDGAFISLEAMVLTIKDSQTRVILGCSTSGDSSRCT